MAAKIGSLLDPPSSASSESDIDAQDYSEVFPEQEEQEERSGDFYNTPASPITVPYCPRPPSTGSQKSPRARRQRTTSLNQSTTTQSKTDVMIRTPQRTIYTAGRPPWYNCEGQKVEPFVIGICGGSASGKTTVAEKIIESLGVPWVTLLSMDSFYKVLSEKQHEIAENNEYNFDHPDAFDWDLLNATLQRLKEGRKVEVPIYNFLTHSRENRTKTMYGANVIIFEGILTFHNPKVNEMLDMKIFVDTDADVRLARRLKRDISQRGRDLDGVLKQYTSMVQITSEQILDSYIARIKQVNPLLNCVVADRFEDARKEARAADELIKSGTISEENLAKEKPLLGVPFTTKDCIAVKGLIHSSGLVCRKHIRAEEDATAITRLKHAGAIPIALTNVSELCMWWESANHVHGRTKNPYDTSRIVGGSSGGEGCAQASALSAFGIGSDIGGSIRMPAFFNGIFGHKPSPLAVPNAGQYPEPVTDEQNKFLGIGPMCRRAEDLLPILKVISNNLPRLRLDDPVDIKKIKFYYQESDGGSNFVSPVSPDIKELLGRISLHLEKAHGIKTNKVSFSRFNKSAPVWFANMKAPSGPTFPEQLTNLKGTINPWWELVKWVFGKSDHTFIGLATCLLEKGGCRYGDEKHQYLVKERDQLRLEVLDVLEDDGVLLYPTHPTSAPYHNQPLAKPFNFSYTGLINVLKLPATAIPMGLNRHGLPIGIQVISNDGNDRLCLAVARELEKAFGGWVPPEVQA